VSFQGIPGSLAAIILSVVLGLMPAAARADDSQTSLRIDNFQKVSAQLWRGAAPSDDGMKDLASAGVKTVIDLRMNGSGCDKESRTAKKLGIKYVHIPLGYSAPPVDKINQVLKLMTDQQNQPVFVHCRQGADRTGLVCGIYRMMVQGWTFDQTYEEMRGHHFKPWLLSMKHTVQAWEPSQPAAQSAVAQKQKQSL